MVCDFADNEQLARLRREAAASDTIDGAAVETALDVLERAAGRLQRAGLVALAERAGRLYGLALARLRREDRRAVRELVRELAGDGDACTR